MKVISVGITFIGKTIAPGRKERYLAKCDI
jgi:hypothetical protein